MNLIPEVRALEDGLEGFHVTIQDHGGKRPSLLRWSDALTLLEESPEGSPSPSLADELCRIVAESRYPAVYFEASPVSRQVIDEAPFEFVILDAASLGSMRPDGEAFAEHFARPPSQPQHALIRSFRNLGGDAILVAPLKLSSSPNDEDYTHLAPFVRREGYEALLQARQLWSAVATELRGALRTSIGDGSPTWLSTCGTGIGWLHVRIDSVPKYYSYRPFREHPTSYKELSRHYDDVHGEDD